MLQPVHQYLRKIAVQTWQTELSKTIQKIITELGKDPKMINVTFDNLEKYIKDELSKLKGKGLSEETFSEIMSKIEKIKRSTWDNRKKLSELSRLLANYMLAGAGLRVLKNADNTNNTQKIYVDMDGVLTDFQRAVKELGPEAAKGLKEDATPEEKTYMLKTIENAGPDFWINMKWKKDGKDLWKNIKQLNPVIITSPGKTDRFVTNAITGKKTWLKNNLPGIQCIFYNDKYDFAEPNAILIDDSKENISAWTNCGGIGILHISTPTTLKLLYTYLNQL